MSVPPLTHRSPLRGPSSSSSLLSTVLTRKLGTSVWQNRCWWEKQNFSSVWSILMSRWRLPQDQQSLCPQLHPKRLGALCCSCLVRWLLYEELPECQWWGWTPLCTGNSLTGCSRPRVSLPRGAQSTSSYSPERDYSYWKCFRKVHGSSSYHTWHSPSETSVLQEDSFLPIHSTFNPPGSANAVTCFTGYSHTHILHVI